jgi:hypothetical protein
MVRADHNVSPQAEIILDVGKAAALNPSQVGFYRSDCAPTLLQSPVEEDDHPLAAPERLLQGAIQVGVIPRYNQQAPRRSARRWCVPSMSRDRHPFLRRSVPDSR